MKPEEFDILLKNFIKHSSENGDLTHLPGHISVGFVVDTDDPLQQGRLRVFCPAYNDDPKKLLHLPWCAMSMPVGGVVNNYTYARGSTEGSEGSEGAVHYGFWAVPDIGAHVLVACINGDHRRRVWLGCLPAHQETHTIGNGRFKHENESVDGPLTSNGTPIEPLYSKLHEAFNDESDSAEWKTRAVDYQLTALFEPPNRDKSVYVDDDLDQIQQNEQDEWVREILGEHGYEWSGYKNLGAYLASRVQSWTSPGFHSITVDDRPYNCRIRIRTTGGSQIILDDTNERMYFSTSGGKSWIELDNAGNIDVYAERRMSIHADKDVNISAGESIRFKAGKFISMYAGDNRGQTPLTENVPDGDIRIQSSNDLHIKSENNIEMQVEGDFKSTVVGETNMTFVGTTNIGIEDTLNIGALNDINLAGSDVTFTISGKGTTVDTLTAFLDDFVETFNDHIHVDAGANLNPESLIQASTPVPIDVKFDETKLAPWTNRVPQHEPWPRVLMQDSDDPINEMNDGYKNNVDWVEQYDNVTSPEGRKPIGKVEGDEELERGLFWRR